MGGGEKGRRGGGNDGTREHIRFGLISKSTKTNHFFFFFTRYCDSLVASVSG